MQKIDVGKITRPFQLLATVFLGLVMLEGEFIYASLRMIEYGSIWAVLLSFIFGVSAVFFVPKFLLFIFRLLTEFRSEMQDDEHYAKDQVRKYRIKSKCNQDLKYGEDFKYKKINTNTMSEVNQ